MRGGGGAGAHHEEAGVLIPRRGQPVGCERRGQAAAYHEAEVAPAGARDEAVIDRPHELVDDASRLDGLALELAAEPRQQVLGRRVRAHGPLRQRREVLGGVRGGLGEQLALVHLRDSTAVSLDSPPWPTASSSSQETEPARS